jgi:hypothetical protein
MRTKNSTAVGSLVPAKGLVADAIGYLEVKEWTRPVIRAALMIADRMYNDSRESNPSQETLAADLGCSADYLRKEVLPVFCRTASETHEDRHMFVRRLVSTGEGKGRKSTVYALAPEFEAMVMKAREDVQRSRRPPADLPGGPTPSRSNRPTGGSEPTYRGSEADLPGVQTPLESVVRTPYVEAERERSRTALPPDHAQQSRSVALHYLGTLSSHCLLKPSGRPDDSRVRNVAVIASKMLKAGHSLDDLKAASAGAIAAARADDWYADKVTSPSFVWKEQRINEHAAMPSKPQDWERAGYGEPWSFWEDRRRQEENRIQASTTNTTLADEIADEFG